MLYPGKKNNDVNIILILIYNIKKNNIFYWYNIF